MVNYIIFGGIVMSKNKELNGVLMVKKNGKIIYFDVEKIEKFLNKNKENESYKR